MNNVLKVIGTVIAISIIIIAIVLIITTKYGKEVGLVDTSNKLNVENNVSIDTSKTGGIKVTSADDLVKIIDDIYEKQAEEMPRLNTQILDMEDEDMVKNFTALKDVSDLEYVVVSEPLISSQAYSLVMAKVKDGANADLLAKEMNENVDIRKWICVSAEMVYTTTSNNVIFLVMSADDIASPVYETFKEIAGTIGKEYERIGEINE